MHARMCGKVDGGESAWQQRRRSELASAIDGKRLKTVQEVKADAVSKSQSAWTEKHSKEVQFQEDKRVQRKVEAHFQSTLLPKETNSAFRSVASELKQWQDKTDRRRIADDLRKTIKTEVPPDRVQLLRASLHIEEGLQLNAQSTKACTDLLIAKKTHPKDARVFLVNNPAKPCLTTRWAVMLMGGSTCSVKYLESHGKLGVSVTWERCTLTSRHVWMSKAFITNNPRIAELVRSATTKPGNKWKLLASGAGFFEKHSVAVRNNRPLEVVAMVTPSEKQTADTNCKHIHARCSSCSCWSHPCTYMHHIFVA